MSLNNMSPILRILEFNTAYVLDEIIVMDR